MPSSRVTGADINVALERARELFPPHSDYITKLQQEHARYRKALEDIQKHMQIIMPRTYESTATWRIAAEALQGREV